MTVVIHSVQVTHTCDAVTLVTVSPLHTDVMDTQTVLTVKMKSPALKYPAATVPTISSVNLLANAFLRSMHVTRLSIVMTVKMKNIPRVFNIAQASMIVIYARAMLSVRQSIKTILPANRKNSIPPLIHAFGLSTSVTALMIVQMDPMNLMVIALAVNDSLSLSRVFLATLRETKVKMLTAPLFNES